MPRTARKRMYGTLEKRVRLNADALRDNYARAELERDRGYAIYKLLDRHRGTLVKGVKTFWVVKNNVHGYTRGQKILKKSEMESFVRHGGKVREIQTFSDKHTKNVVKEMARYFDVPMPGQHGFTRNRSIDSNLAAHLDDRTHGILNVDLENAFHQVTTSEVYLILRIVFDINKRDAMELAELFTHNGKLFQGNPVSPLIFNIATANMARSLAAIKWLKFTQYADDCTFSFEKEYIGYRLIKWLVSIIRDCGMKVNPSKSKRYRTNPHKAGAEITGLHFWKTTHKANFRVLPNHVKKLRNKIRLFVYLQSIGLSHTRRLNKQATPISLPEMVNGLRNWQVHATANI